MTLTAVTIELSSTNFRLIDHLPKNALTFIRGGHGLVGWGQALRLEASGPNRMQELADQWRAVASQAQVDNPLGFSGTGLVAFGSFAFSENSAAQSVLVVPEVVLGSRDGRVWLTRVTGEGATGQAPDFWSNPSEYGSGSVSLCAGSQSPAGFINSVNLAQEKIAAGEINKVVLARDLVGETSAEFDLRAVLARLASRYETCWVYNVDGTFGASPELLVRVSHGQVSARVLAGTAGRGTDPGVDQAISAALAASAKNLAEHAFAVDSLVASLRPFCSQVDADSKPFSLALPNVWHLASDVHGVLRDNASALDLAAALHPTAAVAGTPRDAALNLIEELEPFDRGRYAGPVGWIGANGDGEWAIALRGGQISGDQDGGQKITAFAGCGIVADSEPEAELAETELKFQPILSALS